MLSKSNIKNYQIMAVLFIAILHLVGLFGLNGSYAPYFVRLTPLNLFISFVIVILFNTQPMGKFLFFLLFAFLLGMVVEIVGVTTGFPFGQYSYTPMLSVSFFKVPVIIGINWFILGYGIISLINIKLNQNNWLVKSLIGAVLMTFIDFLIEPFAIRFKLWVWLNNEVPITNYVAWFCISFFLFLVGFKVLEKKANLVAAAVVLIFVVFFALNIFIF